MNNTLKFLSDVKDRLEFVPYDQIYQAIADMRDKFVPTSIIHKGAYIDRVRVHKNLTDFFDKEDDVSYIHEQKIIDDNVGFGRANKEKQVFYGAVESPEIQQPRSLFAYLYRSGVAYYRNEGDFLYYEYEMMMNWYMEMGEEQDEAQEEGDTLDPVTELEIAEKQGDRFWKKIASRKNINAFGRRLQRYQPVNQWEEQLSVIAQSFLQLSKEYPGSSYFDNIQPALMEDGDEDSNPIRPEHYLSFFWSADGAIYDQLMQCVNNELGEMYGLEEPVQSQLFDKPFNDVRLLDFEKRFLNLIDDLCYLLNQ